VATFIAGLARVFTSVYTMEMSWRRRDGDDFRRMHIRRHL
jgi:hypothetical protein